MKTTVITLNGKQTAIVVQIISTKPVLNSTIKRITFRVTVNVLGSIIVFPWYSSVTHQNAIADTEAKAGVHALMDYLTDAQDGGGTLEEYCHMYGLDPDHDTRRLYMMCADRNTSAKQLFGNGVDDLYNAQLDIETIFYSK